MPSRVCAYTQHEGVREGCPLDKFLYFSGGSREEKVGKCWCDYVVFSHINTTFFSASDTMVPGPGLQLQEPETENITKQETVTLPLNFYVRISKA